MKQWWSSRSARYQGRVLLLSLLVGLVLCYVLAFQKTISKIKEYNALTEAVESPEVSTAKMAEILKTKSFYDSLAEQFEGVEYQQLLLSFLSKTARMQDVAIETIRMAEQKDRRIDLVVAEGRFEQLTRFLREIEQNFIFGEVRSSRMITEYVRTDRSYRLKLELHMEKRSGE